MSDRLPSDKRGSTTPAYAPVGEELARAGGIRLLEVRCTATHRDRSYDEQHSSDCICLVKRGVFTYRTRNARSVLGPGWLMLGNANEPYICSHEHGQDEGDDCVVLSFSDNTVEAIRSAVAECRGLMAFGADSLPPLPKVSALVRILEDQTRGQGVALALAETAFAVADCVLRELAAHGSSRQPAKPLRCRGRDRERIRRARQFIESSATEPLLLDAIASEVDLSPFHFLRIFRQHTGITPHQYLIRARLIRAIGLLRDTALSITAIALEAGYNDLSNFVRTFHREIGCTPRDFRRGRVPRDSKILQERGQPSR